ncbi:hypothetical protein CVIRNUC_005822 [Coccomyxa viridis]|uniref:Uncharacterized protein n=1 Tax=Coccomyxa viridis TaxID=1274662 RepID=A0AAV1I6F1_9CHLO|nr:hypothetical protein CVIRNUC_005822 [Coccomyxa viridis]
MRGLREKCELKSVGLTEIERHLDTGDIVLIPGNHARYLVKLRGAWHGFSACAFVVRTGPGIDSLLLCHADTHIASDKESRSVVTLTPLSREIAEGECKFVVVRKLAKPLRAAERRHVRDFASASVGHCLNAHANILMAAATGAKQSTCLSAFIGPKLERFFCSELVAQMLVQAGQAKLKRNLDFLANGRADGQLLDAPVIAICPTPESADKRLKVEAPAL